MGLPGNILSAKSRSSTDTGHAESLPFLLTVDVEPDWGCTGVTAVRECLPRFCGLLERHCVRGTFFVVGELLESCADVLKPMARVHEVGSHGLTHRRLDRLGDEELRVELVESRRRLGEELEAEVLGFRAPFLKMPGDWFEMLASAGYGYDSSVGSVAPSPRNVWPKAWHVRWHGGVAEIPLTTLRTGLVPFSLTYLRLLAPLGEKLIAPRATIMYLHLHELARPALAHVLPPPLRWLLRRGAGESGWRIMERVLRRVAARAMTCGEFLAQHTNEGRSS